MADTRTARQPVHVVYGGAHLFRAGIAAKLGGLALDAVQKFGPIAPVLGVSEDVAARVEAKLRRQPVEDYRIDFEDGYGFRRDEEEDRHAVAVARELKAGGLPPFIGIRIKPLNQELRARSLRTLNIVLRELGPDLPANFAVTLPKPTSPSEPAMLADRLDALEAELGIAPGTIPFEIMIETSHAFMDEFGASNLPKFVSAGGGRVRGAHFGAYDYTSSLGISSAAQDLMHPACDAARHLMQVAYAPTGIWLADGATNLIPIGDAAAVHEGWRVHYRNVRHALRLGFYQGWDLHPAQIVARYAAIYSFYEEALEGASARLKNFVDRAAQASMVGQQFDDAATGQGLLNFFLRAIHCGAVTEHEARQRTGLTHDEFAEGSFGRIVQSRADRDCDNQSE